LAKLLRPKGLMRLGLFSQTARIPITAARIYLAEHGYQSTVADIRRARQDLIASDLRAVAQSNDFYTTSECRDLLFHVQEHQLTIPQIKSLLAEHGLRFLGFVFDPVTGRDYAQALAQAGRSPADLDAWHAFELQRPDTFRAMYQFWCQKL
jgi:hypothetical protein